MILSHLGSRPGSYWQDFTVAIVRIWEKSNKKQKNQPENAFFCVFNGLNDKF